MKFLICGSGASEGIPSLFCNCALCKKAWIAGGKDRRSRVAYQLGEEIRIDFGPDFMLHRYLYGLHYEQIKHLFITHGHRDHFLPAQLGYHHDYYAMEMCHMTLHAGPQVIKQFLDTPSIEIESMRITLNPLSPGTSVSIPESCMRVTPIKANHIPLTDALNFAFELDNGISIFIGTDSSCYTEESWKMLSSFKFDIVILDATAGRLQVENGGHMNAEQAAATARRMRDEKIARPGARIIVNHFAHVGGMMHADLEDFFGPLGIEPAYDGMEIDLDKLTEDR